MRNILDHIKKCDFLKLMYLYSDFVCARSTSQFEMTKFSESRKSLEFFYGIKILQERCLLMIARKCVGGHL